ncbi:DNA repair protein rad54, putative [Eimeria brunetti]|uniref:DNA repair protein rad54, putative n=1 Tax=Eimeria brunetti TaxID=51314 RepID=U6LU46_9EIME|nr:DNA repair protein rad54, putative [Eimeria brunetti]
MYKDIWCYDSGTTTSLYCVVPRLYHQLTPGSRVEYVCGPAGCSEESLRKTLGIRMKRSACYLTNTKQFKSPPPLSPAAAPDVSAGEPLILYEPQKAGEHKVEVDPMLTRWLREHQREGVRFVFDCLMGLKDFDGCGCILADDMGLGKTLQSITVLWTLLEQGIDAVPGKPTDAWPARRALVVCPASLVNNWAAELQKWLQGRCPCTAVADACKDKVVSKFEGFKYDRQSRVLISSYETFRAHAHRVTSVPIDLIICDEAHRLKNDKTKTSVAISQLPAKRRLLLSGTPIQNDLDEFYSLVSLCNPNVLGDAHTFRRRYASPILVGREPGATGSEQELAAERLTELSSITNLFILRRTNALLAKVLPPKVVINLFCNLTPLQVAFYQEFLRSKCCRKLLDADGVGGSSAVTGKVLSSIQGLMKLCNHPTLVKNQSHLLTGFEKCAKLFEELDIEGTKARVRSIRPDMSGKMLLLASAILQLAVFVSTRLLHAIRVNTSDKVVLISNYTQTLDLFERLCKDAGYPCVRLDGSTSIKKRHDLITKFNEPCGSAANSFAFLLSSKAGGCGVNLVGANRLVLFDPDWNPANDKQRQICKDGLSAMLVSEGENQIKDSLSTDIVRDLFQLRETRSDTHDMLQCQRCKPTEDCEPLGMVPQLSDGFEEDDLLTWAHHSDLKTVPDAMLLKAIEADQENAPLLEPDILADDRSSDNLKETPGYFQPVSFAMSCRVEFNKGDEKLLEANKANATEASALKKKKDGSAPCATEAKPVPKKSALHGTTDAAAPSCLANALDARPDSRSISGASSDRRQDVDGETSTALRPATTPLRQRISDDDNAELSSASQGTTTSEDGTHTEYSDAVTEDSNDSGSE